MAVVTGTLLNGQVVLDAPTDWPDGSLVIVVSADDREPDVDAEISLADDPDSIARWLTEFDSIPAWQMTPEEEARWRTDQDAIKRYTIERMNERSFGDEP